ncbi:MAG: transposase, partial [Rhodoferax sp.]|nr:transposase [Rhodoferax sp.]
MARLARVSVPGHPYHVIQRGNNRQPIFGSDADREKMRSLLAENAIQFDVAIHAYVLMDNHFHLLVSPQVQDALPKMMQAVGRRYVRHFNDTHQRSGTLWEGRYKSALVQSER